MGFQGHNSKRDVPYSKRPKSELIRGDRPLGYGNGNLKFAALARVRDAANRAMVVFRDNSIADGQS